ncbi:hypothetical protein H5S09_03750 [Limosilactobacillus sp. STM2_1]|uniref:Uncharacterized protein n=1 Tax=Limosilactobacillus rudii TaxID=2759755 RepID=A0A7W3YN15_9LACO|nr:hypothetical protein [Limosilactobacillus rudii]MBB1079059.1 hypothetical protein [Limosilactobacillus rudii]MBB1097066.1 hypothetical protein [Limosilactobacillus rudii]MCD7134033.1 hypothetical protein [Limosilactobacillus rudii]
MKALVVILTAMFTGAKLAGAIAWSWWLVFAPVWVYLGIGVAIDFLILIITGIYVLISHYEDRKRGE